MRFSDFLTLCEDETADAVRRLLDGQGLILFFQKGDRLYGAPEESRVVFAHLKSPDDVPEGWEDEANFSAMDLLRCLDGDPVQQLFSADDLRDIVVLDRDDVDKKLRKHKGKSPKSVKGPAPVGLLQLKDKKS